jgi:septal ring factor EnvC (AmiA/AmiB activator)
MKRFWQFASGLGLVFCCLSGWADPAADLQDLRSRINQLQRQMQETKGSHSEAVDALKKSEQAISEANRNLRVLEQQKSGLQTDLGTLRQNSRHTQSDIDAGMAELSRLLREHYQESAPDTLSLILSGKDPEASARELEYLSRTARSTGQVVSALQNNLHQMSVVSAQQEKKLKDLSSVEKKQADERRQLQVQTQERANLVAQLSTKIKAQKRNLESLQKDEKRLTQLVERLTQMLARREEERRARQKRESESGARKPGSPPAVGTVKNVPEAGYVGGEFARLKGKLRLPVQGELLNRFGSPRSDTGMTWKGLFIRTPEGREVKAIAPGQVVFADWLRGFGNIIIVDHGDSYMTLYAGLQTLYGQVGERVKAGDSIATTGSTGGGADSGLYFELRHESKPQDPLKWVEK